MSKEKTKRQKTVRRVILIAVAVILIALLAVVGSVFLVSRHAVKTPEEYAALYPSAVITVAKDGSVEIRPGDGVEERKTGIIFYVGAQIDPEAYVPLLAPLAEEGYYCNIPKMACNVASLNANAADGIIEANPGIGTWYLSGHSLGGFTAAGYAKKNPDKIDGLIFVAAYASGDLSDTDLAILSVYGDADGVLNQPRYQKALDWMPSDFEEHILAGGNHAQFGDYGEQPRDNEGKITAEEQRAQTVAFVTDWLEAHAAA